ncbi:hypothetical protein RJG79_05130 [Mycoplasmatota bacterium WC44]
MKKLLLSLLLVAMISIVLPITNASAGEVDQTEDYVEALIIAEKANEKILDEIHKAQGKALESDNDEIIIAKLIEKTNEISLEARNKIGVLGIDSECTYVAYEIDGQTVMVDPIRVLGWMQA